MVIETSLRGIPFTVHDEDDDLSRAILRNGDFWEFDILDYIRDNYPKQHTIIDVGANIGNHSLYFSQYLNYTQIISFEPIEENFQLLVKNMRNSFMVGLNKYAVSDHSGSVFMTRDKSNYGAHEVRPDGIEEVPCVSIDKLGLMDVSLIKIDAEWHEPQVLDGASETIYRCLPLILIEDVKREYSSLFPRGYEMVGAWDHHNTFLWEYHEL